jgi:hypothetical protein
MLRDPTGALSAVSPGTNTLSTLPDGSKLATFNVTGTIEF